MRSALAPRRTKSTCQNADFARSIRVISPRRRNEPASASTDERLMTVRSRSKKAAAGKARLPDERQRAREPTGARAADRAGDVDDRTRGLRLGLAGRDRDAGVAGLAPARVERDAPEQRHAEIGGEPATAAPAEDLGRHVLDDADDAHAGLLRHRRRACGDLLRER